MLINYCSDLHLQNRALGKKRFKKADVLVLAGDCFSRAPSFKDPEGYNASVEYLRDKIFPKYKRVYYVLGNHDYYHGLIDTAVDWVKSLFPADNLKVLENDGELFEDVLFLGCTLWSSFYNGNPFAMADATCNFPDYKWINKNESSLILPRDTFDRYRVSVGFLRDALAQHQDKRTVIITHHAPLYQCDNPKFSGSMGSSFFCSDLSPLMLDFKQIKAWIYGHTHHNTDFVFEQTRVLSNQRGYPFETNIFTTFAAQKVVEV